jgi:hypothetical protein
VSRVVPTHHQSPPAECSEEAPALDKALDEAPSTAVSRHQAIIRRPPHRIVLDRLSIIIIIVVIGMMIPHHHHRRHYHVSPSEVTRCSHHHFGMAVVVVPLRVTPRRKTGDTPATPAGAISPQ